MILISRAGTYLTAILLGGFFVLMLPLTSHAALLVEQSDFSQVMTASDPSVGSFVSCYQYTAERSGDVDNISFYQNVDTSRFPYVNLRNVTAAAGGNQNLFSWEYAPNNYQAGVADGTGQMERYTLPSTRLRNFYGGSQTIHIEMGDNLLLCLGSYSKPDNFPKSYGASQTLGDGTNAFLQINTAEEVCTENCYPNVLFLPGIQGSVLKEGDDTLWPPSIWSQDVARLALNEAGESVNTIRVAGVLGDFYGADIYGGFADFMDTLVSDETIEEWKPFSYDWRLPLQTVLDDGVLREGETNPVLLIEEIERLASTSRSGKVTVIAHSMGGLLGKLLIQELENQNKEDLIDTFVMVGTPQLGTPQAVASLLHGDQPIELKLFTKSSVVRSIGRNMESTHSLLPSEEYFNEISDPVISFDQTSFTSDWINAWGSTINSYSEFSEFMTGQNVPRARPVETTLAQPEVLRTDIFNSAQFLHENIDNYTLPSTIRVVQVAGWGKPSVKNISYKNTHLIFPGFETRLTIEGDDTVVHPSATYIEGDTYYVNLYSFSRDLERISGHKDLLSITPVTDLLQKVIKHNTVDGLNYISTTKPVPSNVEDQMILTARSPVLVGVKDGAGRFTGISQTNAVSSDTYLFSEEIPGSSFAVFGEDQYIFLPNTSEYEFEFTGTDTGPATIEIGIFENDVVTPIASFTDIPVTPSTIAQFTIDTGSPEETAIAVDEDGDGVIDTTVQIDGYESTPTLAELFAKLKEKIQQINIKDKLKQKLLKKIEKLEKKIAKHKERKASKLILKLEQSILKKTEKGKISESDAEAVLKLLNAIEQAL